MKFNTTEFTHDFWTKEDEFIENAYVVIQKASVSFVDHEVYENTPDGHQVRKFDKKPVLDTVAMIWPDKTAYENRAPAIDWFITNTKFEHLIGNPEKDDILLLAQQEAKRHLTEQLKDTTINQI